MRRESLDDSVRRPLYFARVWEDPLLELEAFAPKPDGVYVVVGSGGCTVLSLLAGGARRVTAVDSNPTQNDLGELKAAMVRNCDPEEAVMFLGHAPGTRSARLAIYDRCRHDLSIAARSAWDRRSRAIATGVERSGMTERLTRLIALVTRVCVHPRRRIEELLTQPTLEAQRAYYTTTWNTRRWRMLLRVLGNQRLFALAYPPAALHHDQLLDPAEFFARAFEHAVTELPVENNYFLHQAFLGRFPPTGPDGLPPYLRAGTLHALRESLDGLDFVDGTFTTHLRRCASSSIDGFALSNICEWMTPAAIEELFAEIVRTATPSAIVCFRNNFGRTEVPPGSQHEVREDRPRSIEMSQRDRSIVTPRFAVCHVADAARARAERSTMPTITSASWG